MSNVTINRESEIGQTVTLEVSVADFQAIIAAIGLITEDFEKDCGLGNTYPLYRDITLFAERNGIDYVIPEWSVTRD